MERFPLVCQGRPVGELTVRPEGEDTWFDVRCRLPEQDLWCIWAVGKEGTLRLGCPEQQSGEVRLSRRFSRRMTAPLGRLSHGELRRAAQQKKDGWERVQSPEQLFRSPWLRKALQGRQGVLTRVQGKRRLVALPFSAEQPFPLAPLFCFARMTAIREGTYLVFAFGEGEAPVFF
ncbi:MAG: hypothetical protein IJX52_02585 [Oscillibacter sp.]|nr:hypothetical protein [Oscillibacter sp.]